MRRWRWVREDFRRPGREKLLVELLVVEGRLVWFFTGALID